MDPQTITKSKKENIKKKINKFDNNEYIKDLVDKININYNFEENNDNINIKEVILFPAMKPIDEEKKEDKKEDKK